MNRSARAVMLVVTLVGCTASSHNAGDADMCLDPCFGHGVPTACCPSPAPDCTGRPDGYPGYPCVDRANPCCSCQCSGGMWQCAC